jgi:flagellar motor switch/type III secretory pathway protein FliN
VGTEDRLGRLAIVPLRLRVETHPVPTKVRRIVAWGPGSFVPIGQSPTANLNLRAGGVVVARGEMLTRRGRFAFQIGSFVDPPDEDRSGRVEQG